MSYNAGSVDAKITLNTEQFEKQIAKVRREIDALKGAFKGSNANNGLIDDIKKLKKEIKSLKDENKSLRKELSAKINTGDLEKYGSEIKKLGTTVDKETDDIVANFRKMKRESKEAYNLKKALIDLKSSPSGKLGEPEAVYDYRKIKQTANEVYRLKNALKEVQGLKISPVGFNSDPERYYDKNYSSLNSQLKQLSETYLSSQNRANAYSKEVRGLGINIDILSGKIDRLSNKSNAYKIGLTNESRSAQSLSARLRNLSNDYQNGKINALEYKNGIKQLENELTKLKQKVSSTSSALNSQQRSYNNANAELKRMAQNYRATGNANKDYIQQLRSTNKELFTNSNSSKSASNGINTLGNSMNKTAHSSRILSNTLYQIRGALLSLKMIFTAMGGMALWGFATQIADGVKTTMTAKNEMEAQLKANSKVDAAGIQYFKKGLDELAQDYKKVNKYMVGETASAIGLEFQLTAKQMKKALPIITMVSSEYVRAGRKEEEAALAMKDILQGEFQRLSRETGVGKEELLGYGWSGDKTDITTLLSALEKAAKDRHWDLFAQKATSLNDVMTITRSRFSEFGADLIDSITPAIVGGFNTIISVVDGLQSAFNSLGSLGQNLTIIGGGMGIFNGLLYALPMVTKRMGLMEIRTIGLGKSLVTSALNLNKFTVAQHGLRKAIAEVITGMEAQELAGMSSTKAILGRALGLDTMTLKEKGWLGAMVKNKAALKEGIELSKGSNAYTMSRAQKLAYLTNNMKLNTAVGLKQNEALKKIITSWTVLGTVIKGVIAIGLVSWFTSISTWCDSVKSRIEAFNTVAEEGYDKIREAKEQMSKYKEGTQNYRIAKQNYTDIETATHLVNVYKKQNAELEKKNDLMIKGGLNQLYKDNGVGREQAGIWTQQVTQAQYDLNKAEQESYKFQYASLQHIKEHTLQLEKAGVSEKERTKYITEYATKAEEAAQHLKQFNEGDFQAGMYYVMDRMSLMWIDLWNDKTFVNFWNSVKAAWKGFQPTLKSIQNLLGGVAQSLLKIGTAFLSSKPGQIVATWTAIGAAIGFVGLKLGKWITGAKSSIDVLSKLGSALKDRIKDWRNYGDEVEKAKKKEKIPSTSTGGINGDVGNKGNLKDLIKSDIKGYARTFAKYATVLAAGMFLMTEAIALMIAPMGALALVGATFKTLEPQIRNGIEGLKLIAPVVAVFLPPVIALALIMNKYGPTSEVMNTSLKQSAKAIAAGMLLVGEAVFMLVAPLLAIAGLGWISGIFGSSVEQGKNAIQTVVDTLISLYPIIPIFVAAIVAGASVCSTEGIGGLFAVGSIVAGMGLVAVAVGSLALPLLAIAALGYTFPDLSGVRQGAEAIKLCASALMDVSVALGALLAVNLELLGLQITQIVNQTFNIDFTSLTNEGGLFDQLSKFTEAFNTNVNIVPIDPAKVTALSDSATGIKSVSDALTTVKNSLNDLPNFNVDNRSPNEKYNDAVSGNTDTGLDNLFSQLEEPINQLNTFVTNFNGLTIVPVKEDKVSAISASANMIATVKTAINNLKNALGSAVDAQWNANMASGGILGAAKGFIMGNGGSSSIKGALDEMYLAVKDIMDFNTRIAGLTSSGSGNAEGVASASNLVSALQTQINNVKTTLQGALPTVKSAATQMGKTIVDAFKAGISTLGSAVSSSLSAITPKFAGAGRTYGRELTDGFKFGAKIKEAAEGEVNEALGALNGKEQSFYDKGYVLGDAFARGYKDGGGIHSPGYAAQAAQGEIGYISQYLQNGMYTLPQQAYQLGSAVATQLSSHFNNNYSFSLPSIDTFKQSLQSVQPVVEGVKTNVSTSFNAMRTGIATNFSNIVSNTRTSLSNMQIATTKNISGIKTSWRGMQTALIASAENIRSQTSQKINKLRDNMASFWKKIQNPSLLIGGSAGGMDTGTRRRKYSNSSKPLMAAGTPSRGASRTNIAPSSPKMTSDILEYIKCMIETGGKCVAGGWNFNWVNPLENKYNKWNTHFGKYHIDSHVNVGKFKNNTFPVKGIAEIAKAYIYDVISKTNYDYYFDDRYDPLTALSRGAFNCYDGVRIILALANAFGFGGGGFVHGAWNGISHVWARIPGLGDIDSTAIQRGYGFTSPKVTAAGTPSLSRNAPKGNTGADHQSSSNNITINVILEGDNYGVDELENRIENGVLRGLREHFNDPYGV